MSTPSAPRVQFIVNADDLGAGEAINTAIFNGIEEGVVSSATVMATGSALESAARQARQFGGRASFGVHLNLTTHQPVTKTRGLAPLLAANGEFSERGVYQARWTPSLVDAASAEWIAQVGRVRDAGIDVSHLDSHHHVHTLPWLFQALKRVQRATGIRRVRGTLSIFDGPAPAPLVRRVRKRLWLWALRSMYSTRTTDELADFLTFRRAVAGGSYAPEQWPRAIELMVHPTDNEAYSGEEARALRSGWMRELPVRGEIVSYAAV